MAQDQNPIDAITKEVEELTDAQLAEAALAIQARKDREKERMTPERKQKMKDREAHRRKLNAAILKAAKAKGLVTDTAAPAAAAEGDAAQG